MKSLAKGVLPSESLGMGADVIEVSLKAPDGSGKAVQARLVARSDGIFELRAKGKVLDLSILSGGRL